jgi:hypothetical protein
MAHGKTKSKRIVKVHPRHLSAFARSGRHAGKSRGTSPSPLLAPGFSPQPQLDTTFRGGKTVQALSFTNVYLDVSNWSAVDISNIDTAISAAMTDASLNNVIQQYVANPISSKFLGNRRSDSPVDETFTRDSVSATLDQLFSSMQLSGLDFSNTVVNLLLPPGTILDTTAADGVGDLDDKDSSLEGLGGFHGSHVASDGTVIYFAAAVYSDESDGRVNGIPVWADPWKNVVATLYHELNEARTDADIEAAMRKQNGGLLGWYSDKGGEIGDIPIDQAGNDLHKVFVEVALQSGQTVPIQLMWSNQAHGPGEPFAG